MQEEKRKICGIDPSTTSTGIALLTGDSLTAHELYSMKGNPDAKERINTMIFEIDDFIRRTRPDKVFIEEPNGKSMKVVKMISNIIGGIMASCYRYEADLTVLTASAWRSALGIPLTKGKKRLKREELKQEDITFVQDRYGISLGDDEADAVCIATAGHLLTGSIEQE